MNYEVKFQQISTEQTLIKYLELKRMSKYSEKNQNTSVPVINNRKQTEPYTVSEEMKNQSRERRGYGKTKNHRSTNRGG